MSHVVRSASQADREKETPAWGSLCWLASRNLTACENLTIGRVTIRRGQSNPPHSHPNCREVLHLLSGQLEHVVGETCVTLGPGDTLVVPAGVPHYARSVGDVDADMIVVYDAGVRQFRNEA